MAASLLAGIVLIAAWIALRPGSSYSKQDREQVFAASSSLHPAGTDGLGRDRLVRVAGALLLSLGGALAASAQRRHWPPEPAHWRPLLHRIWAGWLCWFAMCFWHYPGCSCS
jgi:hypothetical protein